jgi:hypothetical protein
MKKRQGLTYEEHVQCAQALAKIENTFATADALRYRWVKKSLNRVVKRTQKFRHQLQRCGDTYVCYNKKSDVVVPWIEVRPLLDTVKHIVNGKLPAAAADAFLGWDRAAKLCIITLGDYEMLENPGPWVFGHDEVNNERA